MRETEQMAPARLRGQEACKQKGQRESPGEGLAPGA